MEAGQESARPVHRVHRVQQALAVSAAFGAVCVALWGLDATRFAGLYVVIGGAVAAPLFCTRRAQAFVPACLIAGCTLLACGVLFFLLGVFLFWPSALLLLLASFADAEPAGVGRRPTRVPTWRSVSPTASPILSARS
ncbi:hypothetical protein ACH4U5_10790 [Streptomyces sp. NPDC020858]|uniref:hypothetical protein n=1 Tax=Streptomyces sp. NPDC020858 TaxID=3365097 RepID=UPI00379C9154